MIFSMISKAMYFKPFSALNFVAANRKHGQRYAIFVFVKAVLLLANVTLSVVSLIAAYAELGLYDFCHDTAMASLKVAAVAAPFLLFESIYWSFRFKRCPQDPPHSPSM